MTASRQTSVLLLLLGLLHMAAAPVLAFLAAGWFALLADINHDGIYVTNCDRATLLCYKVIASDAVRGCVVFLAVLLPVCLGTGECLFVAIFNRGLKFNCLVNVWNGLVSVLCKIFSRLVEATIRYPVFRIFGAVHFNSKLFLNGH